VSIEPTVGIFDLHLSFQQSPELESSEVDVPDAVVDLFQVDLFAHADLADIDPGAG